MPDNYKLLAWKKFKIPRKYAIYLCDITEFKLSGFFIDFKNGKQKAAQALFGACMKELRGAGDPAVIKELLEKKLSE